MYSKLIEFYTGSTERVGLILRNGDIIEVENVCDQPEEGFEVSPADLIKYGDDIVGTWHTHPGANANLSMNDYETYLAWPHLEHYIIGSNGVAKYIVVNGDVLLDT